MDTNHTISQAKMAAIDIGSVQQAAYSQPCMLPQNQAKEADIRALSELTRALDKKVIHFNICTIDQRNEIHLKKVDVQLGTRFVKF